MKIEFKYLIAFSFLVNAIELSCRGCYKDFRSNSVFCGFIGIANAVQESLNSIFIEFLAAFIELHVYLSPSRASGSPATPISPCCGTTGLGINLQQQEQQQQFEKQGQSS
jgi:hypothetical protein